MRCHDSDNKEKHDGPRRLQCESEQPARKHIRNDFLSNILKKTCLLRVENEEKKTNLWQHKGHASIENLCAYSEHHY